MKYAEILFFKLFIYCWPKYKSHAIFFRKNTPNSLKKLCLEEFLYLRIIPLVVYHWKSTALPLDLVTNIEKYKKIGKIVDYLSSELSKREYVDSIIETPIDKPFKHPDYTQRKLWMLGNNFFINDILFDFERKIFPYKEIVQYILSRNKLNAFTKNYYLSLGSLEDSESYELLKSNPIIIDNAKRMEKYWVKTIIDKTINNQSHKSKNPLEFIELI